MPQFNLYPDGGTFVADDLFLYYKDASGAVFTITGTDLVASVKALLSTNLDTQFSAANLSLDSSYEFVVGTAAVGIIWTLPLTTSSTDYIGKKFYLSNKGAGSVTVARTGSDTINGSTSYTIDPNKSYIFISDGAGNYSVFSAA